MDQDAIDASRISDAGTAQVFAKVERNGDGIVGLFDTNTNLFVANDTISVTPAAMGLGHDSRGYKVQELWTGKRRPDRLERQDHGQRLLRGSGVVPGHPCPVRHSRAPRR